MKLFNASGHPISQPDLDVVGDFGKIVVPDLNPTDIQSVAKKVALAAAPYAEQGTLIALPGMSVIALATVAMIHGIIGFWPRVAFAKQVDGKFAWMEENILDLQVIRTSARTLR